MSEERVYRREGVTIGALAAMLRLPRYRLRQVINEGLGDRNFNAFLNRYRIDEANGTRRSEPEGRARAGRRHGRGLPIDRAIHPRFKADAGMTPTEFRRLALGKSRPGA
jgi:hypothetical protein